MRKYFFALSILLTTMSFATESEKEEVVVEQSEISVDQNNKRLIKLEQLLTSKKWICTNVSKKRLTKKLDFDMGNEINFSIDKKYSFVNNKYDYSNGKWKYDGKFLYMFYNAPGTESRVETVKYKIVKLNSYELTIKRTAKPRGKITFK